MFIVIIVIIIIKFLSLAFLFSGMDPVRQARKPRQGWRLDIPALGLGNSLDGSLIAGSCVPNCLSSKSSGRSTARIYISCHSQMMDNDPQFLPADARGWGDGVSLSWLVRQLDAVRPRNARFYIIVNGCLTDAGRVDRWCRCCRRVQQTLQSEATASLKIKPTCVPE